VLAHPRFEQSCVPYTLVLRSCRLWTTHPGAQGGIRSTASRKPLCQGTSSRSKQPYMRWVVQLYGIWRLAVRCQAAATDFQARLIAPFPCASVWLIWVAEVVVVSAYAGTAEW